VFSLWSVHGLYNQGHQPASLVRPDMTKALAIVALGQVRARLKSKLMASESQEVLGPEETQQEL
jgi:hypothetical protein